jgi:hypothetical protein
MTICINCKYFIQNGPIWYDQFCGADELPATIDPVTGKSGYEGINDLGGKYITQQKHPFANRVNIDGNCPLYQK